MALIIARDSASATTLVFPEICLMSVVNSDMAARWRCCLAYHGSEALASAKVRGL